MECREEDDDDDDDDVEEEEEEDLDEVDDFYGEDNDGESDANSELYEYVMPLSGASPEKTSKENNDYKYQDENNDFTPHARGGHHPKNRRGSNFTDATPRFGNLTNSDEDNDYTGPYGSPLRLPPLPFHVHSHHSQRQIESSSQSPVEPSQRSSETNSSNGQGDVAESLSQSSSNTPVSPTAPETPPMFFRTPSKASLRREPSAMQITFDGTVRLTPLRSPGSVSTASRMEESRKSYKSWRDGRTVGSLNSASVESAEEEEPQDTVSVEDESEANVDPLRFGGITCPMWLSICILRRPKLKKISHFVVDVAPCFWCCGRTSHGGANDRVVLTRLNILCIFFCAVQLAFGLWLTCLILIMDDQKGALRGFAPHLWNLNGSVLSVGILAFVMIVISICTIRVIKEVDLIGAIRYLWVILWLFPFEIFFTINLFDYYGVTQVWIRHWWLQPTMSWFRQHFCEPGTAYSTCLVPIFGGENYTTEDAWCIDNYGSTNCTMIRNNAQHLMEASMLTFYYGIGGWGCVLLCIMLLLVNTLEQIITKPIVQKSRESNVPAWLLLPTVALALVGCIFLYSPSSLLSSSSGADSSWIGIVYLVAAVLFLIALLIGWFLSAFSIRNSGDKKTKSVAVVIFIGVMFANVVMLGTIFIASILFGANLVDYPINESQRGVVACRVDHNSSCTLCDAEIPAIRCPEWTLAEVTKILQTQLKQSATLAAIFLFLYAISVLRFGITLRKHLSMYQIDYV